MRNLNPTEVARQLALIGKEVFDKIQITEYMKQAWSKPDKLQKAPNIIQLINQFNTICNWTSSEILKTENTKDRAVILHRLIVIAEVLFLSLSSPLVSFPFLAFPLLSSPSPFCFSLFLSPPSLFFCFDIPSLPLPPSEFPFPSFLPYSSVCFPNLCISFPPLSVSNRFAKITANNYIWINMYIVCVLFVCLYVEMDMYMGWTRIGIKGAT